MTHKESFDGPKTLPIQFLVKNRSNVQNFIEIAMAGIFTLLPGLVLSFIEFKIHFYFLKRYAFRLKANLWKGSFVKFYTYKLLDLPYQCKQLFWLPFGGDSHNRDPTFL
jgi:hypothetical protein